MSKWRVGSISLFFLGAVLLALNSGLYETELWHSSNWVTRTRHFLMSVLDEEEEFGVVDESRAYFYSDFVDQAKKMRTEAKEDRDFSINGRRPDTDAMVRIARGLYWWGVLTVLASTAGVVAVVFSLLRRWRSGTSSKIPIDVVVSSVAGACLVSYVLFMFSVSGAHEKVVAAGRHIGLPQSAERNEGFTGTGILVCIFYALSLGLALTARMRPPTQKNASTKK